MWRVIKLNKHHAKAFSSVAPTIFALCSGHGKCGVAVIRVSGPRASEAIFKMTTYSQLPKPRTACLNYIKDPETREELDKGLILWFPGPKSFTGEDSCEFQVHGGPAVVSSILAGLSKLPNFRPAEAGEFTKRAFYAGKLDLTEVEGLADLIHAETDLQRKQAFYQMEGTLSGVYDKWRATLLKNLANVEAYIDFGEDDDISESILQAVNNDLSSLGQEIKNHLSDGRKGERLRDGIQATIIGEPNAGKSSLLNAICRKPAAIVTPQPGTTRDTIQIHLNVNGFPVTLVDTAGLRTDATDMVEKEGIERAQKKLQNSDLVLLVIDVCALFENSNVLSENDIKTFIQKHIKSLNLGEKFKNYLSSVEHCEHPKSMVLFNKIDLLTAEQKIILKKITNESVGMNFISCKTEEGFQSLINDVTGVLKTLCAIPSRENPTLTQTRHRHNLNEALKYLNEYFICADQDIAVAAQRLRLSLRHLGKITGVVSSEEILDSFQSIRRMATTTLVLVFEHAHSPKIGSLLARLIAKAAGGRFFSKNVAEVPSYFCFEKQFCDESEKSQLVNDFKVFEKFLSEEEEISFVQELDPQLKKMRYERGHWDNAIKGYRETEKIQWTSANAAIIEKVKNIAFQNANKLPLKHVHVLDLDDSGIILPHIDSVKFCGETIAGISLLSDSVMRLINEKDKTKVLDVLLKRRSLYIMTGIARYNYTHEILGNPNSKFGNQIVEKHRRISVICRNEP